MLRRLASHNDPRQGHAGLDKSPCEKVAADQEALLRLLGHPVPPKVDSYVFTDDEKSRIYTDWIKGGKPHNLVCSECRSPDDLMLCETCCPADALTTQSNLQGPSVYSSPVDSQQQRAQNVLTMASNSDIMSRARQFLIQHGKFPTSQDFHPELLSNLGTMMLELESQQLLLQEIQDLREENASLRREALKTKHHYPSRMPINESVLNSPSHLAPRIQTPSPDTAGKSWDRIVMDLI
ncbi:hypothetical protein Aspvir_010089 [Aspergillus viridinutans]|uniref:Uncharacterized protein n=1 Tax=Aspergillus viridinutans TaxID=75553 RepID=A0A9P3C4Z4_ASPVI|nr:uncharacterized protein Aspvir_010089 [Aspergillus viridinutans]GIK05972.1 hypothetical protein Aspvir_010089 [Aspergillus viridinutans]